MAFFEDMQKKSGVSNTFATAPGGEARQPGQPRMPEAPGLPATPGQPAAFPVPPAPAAGPVGRPEAPPGAAFTGQSAPRPLPLAPGGTQAGVVAPAMPGGQTQPQQTGTPAGPPVGGAAATQPVQPTFQFDRIPSAEERAMLGAGSKIITPYGEVTSDGKLIPSPEGAALFQQAVVHARSKFGLHPWTNDPNAPPPPARVGGHMFNPFNGQWTRFMGDGVGGGKPQPFEHAEPAPPTPAPAPVPAPANPYHPVPNNPQAPTTPIRPGGYGPYLWSGQSRASSWPYINRGDPYKPIVNPTGSR